MVEPSDSTPRPTAAALFGLVWETMADLIGTAATATLMRRSVKRASERHGDIGGLVVSRDGFQYTYLLPEVWQQVDRAPLAALQELVHELCPLLTELSGPVVIRRLQSVAELQRNSILFVERSK